MLLSTHNNAANSLETPTVKDNLLPLSAPIKARNYRIFRWKIASLHGNPIFLRSALK